MTCKTCGLPKKEHSINGGAYGLCREYIKAVGKEKNEILDDLKCMRSKDASLMYDNTVPLPK
jgi:hypothetical protein